MKLIPIVVPYDINDAYWYFTHISPLSTTHLYQDSSSGSTFRSTKGSASRSAGSDKSASASIKGSIKSTRSGSGKSTRSGSAKTKSKEYRLFERSAKTKSKDTGTRHLRRRLGNKSSRSYRRYGYRGPNYVRGPRVRYYGRVGTRNGYRGCKR